jgi:hypothetical protein
MSVFSSGSVGLIAFNALLFVSLCVSGATDQRLALAFPMGASHEPVIEPPATCMSLQRPAAR